MYLCHIDREAEVSPIARAGLVTESARMRACDRAKSIPEFTGKMAGGCCVSPRDRGGKHELPTHKQRQPCTQPRSSSLEISRRQRPGGMVAEGVAAVLKQ